jgi:hypothetical protein
MASCHTRSLSRHTQAALAGALFSSALWITAAAGSSSIALPGERAFPESITSTRDGIIDGVRNVVVYANIGHSVFSDDGGHFYAGGGFKVVIGR